MSVPYTRIPLDQGTASWLAWRNQGIGASEAAAILGENPWQSRRALFAEKCGPSRRSFNSPAMAYGTATEPEARAHYVAAKGVHVDPACIQSTTREWQRASLDGLAADGSLAVEIKVGEKAMAITLKDRRPPRYYVGQLQHILAVTGLEAIDFWCYWPGRPHVHVTVDRDDAYISRMVEAEAAFWAEVLAVRAGSAGQRGN